MKYSDAWVYRDNDGRFGVAHVLAGSGHIAVTPYTWPTMEQAQQHVDTILALH